MSVHCLSSISPIGFIGSRLKPEKQNVKCIGIIPAGISAATSVRKPYNFARGVLVSKAVNTDESEVLSSLGEEESTYDFDFGDVEDEGSPWEGAIVYRRNSSVLHMEYCTTLERLGLGKLSSELSTPTASIMGLHVTKDVKDYVDDTPVLISVDITRKKHKLRLDGIIRTVITLGCNRCGEPATESVYSNLSLLLTEERVEEPDIIDIGSEMRSQGTVGNARDEEDEDDASIDIEDRLYFPPEEKEIDISKQIRDLIHLEITINTICDAKCKGLCLQCGTNLNTSVCKCSSNQEVGSDVGFGPLGDLRKQMQDDLVVFVR